MTELHDVDDDDEIEVKVDDLSEGDQRGSSLCGWVASRGVVDEVTDHMIETLTFQILIWIVSSYWTIQQLEKAKSHYRMRQFL